MEKIFLKNYKGFKNQMIDLMDVNFLVGENSTGKTSLLKIINLLSNPEFWYNYEFNNNEVELGYFEEIIDKRSVEKFFQLGIQKENKDNTENPIFRINCEFIEENSIPILSSIKSNINDLDILIKFTKKQITYRVKKQINQTFNEWVVDYDFPKTFKKLGIHFRSLPISILIELISNEINTNDSKKNIRNRFVNERLYNNYKWLAPIRAKAKRTYESYKIKFSPEGEHIPSLLRQILSSKSTKEKQRIINVLEHFGKDSNLFDKIEIKDLGKKNSSPFEIIVKYNDIEVKLPNVGYGVSQSLPLIIEILSSNNICFSIQQPEVHLHPKAQSAFGSFLFNSALNDNNKFIIETHSDFTINRFRHKLNKNNNEKVSSKVLFFERTKNGNRITDININKNGIYKDLLPDSYRDFFIDEEIRLLEL
ncbi:AAA family ATPase [Tenacibaculum finnmarkense]|uniref:AAA family ATPase n=1 Tax=Tenacibaculum finnmarkense TaxID=2781243 RepID=UPI001E5C4C7A|nr:AAA family ATPase [Tenacibaculum finnmarkense]MCD8401410.1 ATP-binding protein [Tenacibaculum finnmarkense genomovar ulcerans]